MPAFGTLCIFTTAVVMVLAFYVADGAKVVVFQMDNPYPNSHFFMLNRISKELASRGHSVMVLTSSDTAKGIPQVEGVVAETHVPLPSFGEEERKDFIKWARRLDNYVGAQLLIGMAFVNFLSDCGPSITNATLVERIKEYNPDVLVHDLLTPCANIWADRLDVPLVSIHSSSIMETWHNGWIPGSPWHLSLNNPIAYHPQSRLGVRQPRTFWQRLRNSWLYFLGQLLQTFMVDPSLIALMRRNGVDLGRAGSKGRPAMVLVNADFAIEPPRPFPPHIQHVGPIMVEPSLPLPADLQAFMNDSPNGVVVVAAGTQLALDEQQLREMGRAFSSLPARVLWKVSEQDAPNITALQLGDNVKVMRWLPQNDLLAHNKTLALVTHGGANSIYEAMWHGVPVVGLPGAADQPDNVVKVVGLGAGLSPSYIWAVQQQPLHEAVLRVLTEPAFRENARRISTRLRSNRRSPVQRAADWIEHVVATGGEAYMRPPVDQLGFFVRHSLDVATFWTLLGALPVYLLWRRWRREPVAPASSRSKTD